MPVQPTYPGVYIEEIPSDVRTITGVPTAITAFVGRALRGPVNKPVTIHSFGEFARIFGGLWQLSNLGYAVSDFFSNAPGGEAIIVRLFHPAATTADPNASVPAKALLDVNGLKLEARDEGAWGDSLRARIDHDTGSPDTSLFNLTLAEVKLSADKTKVEELGRVEVFRNVSVDRTAARRVDKVLESESALVRATGTLPQSLPQSRPAPHAEPTPNEEDPTKRHALWGGEPNNMTSSGITQAGSEGTHLVANDFIGGDAESQRLGIYALESADIFNLLSIPPFRSELPTERPMDIDPAILGKVIPYVEKRRAMLILDPPSEWSGKWKSGQKGDVKSAITFNTGIGDPSKNAAMFFPRLLQPDPMRDNIMDEFAPSGAVAGVFARTDAERGVWKAPAGTEATLVGVPDLSVRLTDAEIGEINPLGVNALRLLPAAGRVVWGARTRRGADRLADQWKYIPVRRLALFIEESVYRGTQWAVFEPNDEPLWASIRLNVGAFMHSLFRQGAFQGAQPRDAYLVKCDRETTTQDDINRGIVNVVVGFAPLKPAEFVIIRIQQLAGQIQA